MQASGRVEVASRAVASIVVNALREVPGVLGMVAREPQRGPARLLHWADARQGIDAHLQADPPLIDVYLALDYGAHVAETAAAARATVEQALRAALSLKTVQVAIRVQSVRAVGQGRKL